MKVSKLRKSAKKHEHITWATFSTGLCYLLFWCPEIAKFPNESIENISQYSLTEHFDLNVT